MSLDFEFINRAQKVTSFNLSPSDFTSLKYKKEIQHLFNAHFFPQFDITKTIKGIDKAKLNKLIDILKSEDSLLFSKLHNYNLKGVGPGETTIFFLVDDAYLGGGSSAGVDIYAGGDKYEIKAVKLTKRNEAVDFRLGGTVPLTDIMVLLNNLRKKLSLGGSPTEMSETIMTEMRIEDPQSYESIQDKFVTIAYNSYFKNHDIIFINNKPGADLGKIEAIKRVAKKDIFIERVTGGTIKPKVKL